jgi:hypothetical protein
MPLYTNYVLGGHILFGMEASILTDFDGGFNHRNRHLEQQDTEKIEFELRDVDGIRISRCVPRVAFWEVISALHSNINRSFSPQPAAPLL